MRGDGGTLQHHGIRIDGELAQVDGLACHGDVLVEGFVAHIGDTNDVLAIGRGSHGELTIHVSHSIANGGTV